jgi:hypothetical protein
MLLRTSVDAQRTTRRHIPEDDDTRHNHRCKNLKSYVMLCSLVDRYHRFRETCCIHLEASIYRTTRRHIPEVRNLHADRYENLISHELN